jgi:hypothetical protein
MRHRWQAALIALVLALVACAETHDPTSIEIRDAANMASGRAGHAVGGVGGAQGPARITAAEGDGSAIQDSGIAGPVGSNVKPAANTPDGAPLSAPAATNHETEVWIGQLWSISLPALCDPADPGAPWKTTRAAEPMGYIDRALLVVEHVAGAELQGRIQLGEGALPTSPGDGPYDESDTSSIWVCSIEIPTKGVEYTLLDPVLTSDRLMFEISASEVWNPWCQTQSSPCPGAPDGTCPPKYPISFGPVCACENGACMAAEHDHVAFDLVVTADTIEGQLPFGGAFGTPAELRLHRVQ